MSCFDTKQSDGEVPVMIELWGLWSIPSLPLLPGPFWSGEIALDRVLSISQIELNCVLTLNWIPWSRTVLTLNLRTYVKLNCLKKNYFFICVNKEIYLYKMKCLKLLSICLIKWPEKGWYDVKQTNQLTNQPTNQPIKPPYKMQKLFSLQLLVNSRAD